MEGDITHQSLSLLAGVAIDQGTENGIIQAPVEFSSNIEVIDGQHISKIVELQYVTDESGSYYVSPRRSSEILYHQGHNESDGNTNLGILVLHESPAAQEHENQYVSSVKTVEEPNHCFIGDRNDHIYSSADAVEILTYKKCFLCNEVYNTKYLRDLFDEENQQRCLSELINQYIHSPSIAKYKSKKEYTICQLCVDTILNWHSYCSRIKDVQRSCLSVTVAEQSEEENNCDRVTKTKIKTQFTHMGSRKYRHTALQIQIKNALYNSSYHHLIKRNLLDDDFENIAQRLNSTKSNSSNKIKEIESLLVENDKILSIFCSDCGKSIIGGLDSYKVHRSDYHNCDDTVLTFPCDLCGEYYPAKDTTGLSQSYFSHWLLHLYFHQCHICKERFPNSPLLKKHEEVHTKRPKFPCPVCDKILAKKVTLEKHIKTHLPAEEKKKLAKPCHICGKIITAPTLKAHIYSVHSNERPWKCEVCGSTFKHKSDLTGHRNAVHLKIKNFHCKICSRSFGHHCGLRTHMAKHENRREHECNLCLKKFITNWHLKKHLISHKTEKDVICQVCNKGFKKEDALQEHMTIHTGEKPHECHICGRKVRVLSNLYKHFLVHKKNKTYYSKKEAEVLGNSSASEMNPNNPNLPIDQLATVQNQSSRSLTVFQTENVNEKVNHILQVNRSKNVTYPGHNPMPSSSVVVTKAPSIIINAGEVLTDFHSTSSTIVAGKEIIDKATVLHSNKSKHPTSEEMWNPIYFNF